MGTRISTPLFPPTHPLHRPTDTRSTLALAASAKALKSPGSEARMSSPSAARQTSAAPTASPASLGPRSTPALLPSSLERPHLDAAQQPGNLGLTTRAATTDLGDDAAIAEGRALGQSLAFHHSDHVPVTADRWGVGVRSRVEGARDWKRLVPSKVFRCDTTLRLGPAPRQPARDRQRWGQVVVLGGQGRDSGETLLSERTPDHQ